MPEKTKNPFVVEVESTSSTSPADRSVDKPASTVDKQQVPVKEVVKPVVVEQTATVEKKVLKMAPPPESERTQIQWGMFFAGVGITLIVVGISGALWWMKSSQVVTETGSQVASPTPVAMTEASPSPTPVVWAREVIEVDVLNASGVTGEATRIASQIQALGYKKGDTGNAAEQTGSTVSFSEDVATLSAEIQKDFDSILDNLSVDDEVLEGEGMVRVVIGK